MSFCCLKQFRCGYSAILHLSNRGSNFNIKVDLVPMFSHNQRWYVFGDVAYSDNVYVHRISESFALKELDKMRSLPCNARKGYVMAKSLRDVHLLSHMMGKPILSDLVDLCLPSHNLKHALFFAFDQEKYSLKPHEWAQRIYVQLTNEKLGKFFSRSDEYYKGMDELGRENDEIFRHKLYLRQSHLNLFMHRRRPDLQAFDPDINGDQYRKLFIEEILQILK